MSVINDVKYNSDKKQLAYRNNIIIKILFYVTLICKKYNRININCEVIS